MSNDDLKRARAKCPECGKVMGVAPPLGGDGSMDVFPRHYPGKRPVRLDPISRMAGRCRASRWDVRDGDYVVTI